MVKIEEIEEMQTYWNALASIANGQRVEHLDDIRNRCSVALMSRLWEGRTIPVESLGYAAQAEFVHYAAQAENNILGGMEPEIAYGSVSVDPEFRTKCQSVLERTVDLYVPERRAALSLAETESYTQDGRQDFWEEFFTWGYDPNLMKDKRSA